MSGVDRDMPEPASGLPRLVFRLRTQGPRWIAKRLSAEALYPTTGPGRLVHALTRRTITAASALPRLVRRVSVPAFPAAERTLFAFYDLKVAPITFDCLWFLAGADLERRRRGLDMIHVVIVPGPYQGVRRERDDYEAVVDLPNRGERIQNILVQACGLLPSCAAVTQAATREEAVFFRSVARHVFPADYEPALPVYPSSRMCLDAARGGEGPIAVLRATPERQRNVGQWLAARGIGDRRLVTITMRGYGYMPVRNSNVAAWTAFARGLDPKRYAVVFVPDTEETMEGIPAELDGSVLMPEAAWNLGLRMALYQKAFVNMGVNTGPMGLCWLNETTRYATLKMAPSGVPQTTIDFFHFLGFEPGCSLPFATPCQQLIWEEDSREVIDRAFADVVARIAAQSQNQSAIAPLDP
jgi:hypothetical protein